jgi:hypothetical protein
MTQEFPPHPPTARFQATGRSFVEKSEASYATFQTDRSPADESYQVLPCDPHAVYAGQQEHLPRRVADPIEEGTRDSRGEARVTAAAR